MSEYCLCCFSNENVRLQLSYFPKRGDLKERVSVGLESLATGSYRDFFLLSVYVENFRKRDYPSIGAYSGIDDFRTRVRLHLQDIEEYFDYRWIKDAIQGVKWTHVPFDWGPYK